MFDRILLLATVILAAYQVVVGIEGFTKLSILAYTIAFGVLLIAGLLLIILGFEVLDSPAVVIASTIIPLALSLGLVWEYLPTFRLTYLIFAISGFLAVVVSRLISKPGKLPIIIIALVHGVAGLIIFLLPIFLSAQKELDGLVSFVGVGGALIGIGGLLLSFYKVGKPILPKETIFKLLPGLLLMMMVCFVIGFKYG
jgi:hypothetical protein